MRTASAAKSGRAHFRESKMRDDLDHAPRYRDGPNHLSRQGGRWGVAAVNGGLRVKRGCAAHLPPGAVYAQRESATDDQEAAAADVIVEEAEVGRNVGCEERASYDGRRQQHAREQEKVCHAGACHQGC
eukprot:scaffold49926_cov55-Phaeocystis_antarctica.AAC.2